MHHLVAAYRNLRSNKLFTVINLVGLAVSIAVCLTLLSYVRYHLSFDKFYNNGNKIYRVNYTEYQSGQPVLQSARTHDRTALLIHEYVPEIEAVTRLYHEKAYVWTSEVKLMDQVMLYADSSFFKVFDVDVIAGSAETGLVAPLSVMISRSQSQVYFGERDPIGQTLFFNERLPFVVTGVFEDIPATSSIEFDFLLSWSTMPYYGWIKKDGDFSYPWTFTYVRLRDNVEGVDDVNKKLSALANEQITSLKHRGHTASYELQQYESLHTSAPRTGEIIPGVNKVVLYALISMSVFILAAGWINYINLSLARAIERTSEIGIRKVFGAGRAAIARQFAVEAILTATITFVSGVGLYFLVTQRLSHVFFNDLSFARISFAEILNAGAIYILLTALISSYPAFYASRLKPALIVRSSARGTGRTSPLQNVLIVFQFFLAVSIVTFALMATKQVDFMKAFDAGFNTQQTMAVRAPASTNSDSLRLSRWISFRNEVLLQSGFKSGTFSFNVPGEPIRFHDEAVHVIGSNNEKKQSFSVLWIDEGYVETFSLKILAGRDFRQEGEESYCMINESAMTALGYKSPDEAVNNVLVNSAREKLTVIAVLKDYHHESASKVVEPTIFIHRDPFEYGYFSFLLDSFDAGRLEKLKTIFDKHFPSDQFVFHFTDDFFEKQYREDETFGKLLRVFSGISLFVACLGLFGIASVTIIKRNREIGIRKVLGASSSGILALVSTSYIRLILISCALGAPLTIYLGNRWLSQFSNRIDLQWWMILLPCALMMILTFLTISIQSIRTATKDPAVTLREN